jgi:predicted DsbA family dithiol-disulfide isomerase
MTCATFVISAQTLIMIGAMAHTEGEQGDRAMQIQISVTSDFVCPWCYIGEKRLAHALERLPTGIDVQLQWLPFELNPDMPPEGMDRRSYRSRKFGSWERSQAMDAQTVLAGRDDGATFDYEAIKRTPNTLLAHRVSWLAQREGKQRAFVEAAFRAYFAHGRDIGSEGILADIASEIGVDRDAVAAFLSSDDGAESVRALERTALERGVQGVPYFDIGGTTIVGAQPAEAILQTVIEAVGRLAPRAAV